MPVVKKIRGKGATGVVTANAEVLFTPGAPVGTWVRTFSLRARAAAEEAAPTNKRPRWSHYGAPLKKTMRASTEYDPLKMRVHAAVGSTAPHSVYVDQGTGIYAGNGPYEGKILPPWTPGGASLYEHTWRPRKGADAVGPVMIKGQKGQFFLDAGLTKAFAMARMATATIPGRSASVTSAINSAPDYLTNFLGNTRADQAFVGQLKEWRAWRDAAYRTRYQDNASARQWRLRNPGVLDNSRRARQIRRQAQTAPARKARRLELRALQAKRYRERMRIAKGGNKNAANAKARANDRLAFLTAMRKKYGASNVVDLPEYRNGRWYITIQDKDSRGRTIFRETSGKAKS